MRHLDLSLLRTFVAVAETTSATRAADRVHLTQAAVSQQIKRLEEGLGQPLFDRDQRRFRLTATGERLVVQARRILSLNDEILGGLTDPEADGEVTLGVPHDLLRPLLPPVLRRYREAWPRFTVRFLSTTTSRLRAAYDRGEVDLCLTTELDRPNGSELLFPDRLVWVGAPGGLAWLQRPLPVALGDDSCAFRDPTLEALRSAGREWRTVCEWSDIGPIQAVCEADTGVAALLCSAIPEGLVVVPQEAELPPLPIFNVNLYPPRGDAGRAAHELARLLRQSLIAATFAPRLDAAA
jgi:DNA-binding transcriptional LysR family regulator